MQNFNMADVWANSMASHPRATYHIAGCCHLVNREFTVTIPEPHVTLQGAVTWRNQCHDRATLQGVRIPSALLRHRSRQRSGLVHRCCPSIHLSVCLSVCRQNTKNAIFSKTISNLEPWCHEAVHGLFKEPIVKSLKSKMA